MPFLYRKKLKIAAVRLSLERRFKPMDRFIAIGKGQNGLVFKFQIKNKKMRVLET